ncbi:redox-sensing transcriptional repressor Rex [Myxococcota bacterium]|nr:redox-sensing transcriptional repressor Rex [Myxococcota bacterium]MBU1534138.1 redox-sensing transcriptional repressor Rex [Myxococcota bacterium]
MTPTSNNGKTGISIPAATMERLPRYLMQLFRLRRKNCDSVNSQSLGEALGLKDTQIRKDLSYFGVFGKARYGYNVEYLIKAIESILGLTSEYNLAIIGVGNLGKALANYAVQVNSNFVLKLLVDTNPEIIGTTVADLPVRSMDDLPQLLSTQEIHIGIIAVPEKAAVDVANILVEGGVRALYNFSQAELHHIEGVFIENASISYGVYKLAHHLSGSWPRKK